jgi:hypothetical protein
MTEVHHDKVSRLVHGLALGFRTGMVSASLFLSCQPFVMVDPNRIIDTLDIDLPIMMMQLSWMQLSWLDLLFIDLIW